MLRLPSAGRPCCFEHAFDGGTRDYGSNQSGRVASYVTLAATELLRSPQEADRQELLPISWAYVLFAAGHLHRGPAPVMPGLRAVELRVAMVFQEERERRYGG